jgi:serine/threonine protein kinase
MRGRQHAERVAALNLQEVCAELERRWCAGDAWSAETALAAHPALNDDTDAALEVIFTEFVAREHLGQRPAPADFYERFPQWRHELEQLFQIHGTVGAASAVAPAVSPGTPFPELPRWRGLTASDLDNAPRRIDNYELLGEIGRGGMGVVYKARQIALNRVVALKMILAGVDAGPQERARFRAEAEAAARLQHPNIVQIHEVNAQEGRPFLSLEYVEGANLAELLTGAPWPAVESARLIETLARAMHYAHQQGVVHRDLKPANVLLQIADCRLQIESGATADDKSAICILQSAIPKITDFGLARRLPTADTDAPTGPTRSGAIVGTPAYMAPEQATGTSREVGPAADIYALGVMLYELLTGRPPFQGVSVLETLEQVRTCEPLPPSKLLPTIPRDIDTICLKCLQKTPERRYPSAAALADDLGRFLRGEPVRARPTPTWEKTLKWAKRRPAVAALLSALVVLTLLGLTSVTVLWRQTEAALTLVQKERDEKDGALASKLIALAQRDWLANDLDAARANLDECPPTHRGGEWRYLYRVCHAQQLVFGDAKTQTDVHSVAWSPDGRRVASKHLKGIATVWDLETGQKRHSLESDSAKYLNLAIDSNGRLVIVRWAAIPIQQQWTYEITSWEVETGRQVSAYTVGLPASGNVLLSRNGRRIAHHRLGKLSLIDIPGQPFETTLQLKPNLGITRQHGLSDDGRMYAVWSLTKKEVHVWDTATEEMVGPVLSADPVNFLTFSPDGRLLAVCGAEREHNSGVLKVWDYRAGKEIIALRNHPSAVTCAAFSPDGRRLATGSADKSLKIWDLEAAREQCTLRGHLAGVVSVAFSPDGTRLASGGKDGTVRIWDVRPFEERLD